MKKLTLATAIALSAQMASTSVFAAESAVLREIMGEQVYENSGISDLSEDELKVLETWILNNAVEKRAVTRPAVPEKKDTESEPVVVESQPRYVRIAEDIPEPAKEGEEPVTQKYVLVDAIEEKDRDLVEPDLIRSRIDGPFKGWRNNKTRFRLENGEIWEQRQASTYITNLDSPEVIIRKGRFGYTMEVPAIGRKVHVRRIR